MSLTAKLAITAAVFGLIVGVGKLIQARPWRHHEGCNCGKGACK